jgi:hypothetical protein
VTLAVAAVGLSAGGEERGGRAGRAVLRRHVQRRGALLGGEVGVKAGPQQLSHGLLWAALGRAGSRMKSIGSLIVSGGRAGAGSAQRRHARSIASLGKHQQGAAAGVVCVCQGLGGPGGGQQRFQDGGVGCGRPVQRGVAVAVNGCHGGARRQQQLHAPDVSLGDCGHERGVAVSSLAINLCAGLDGGEGGAAGFGKGQRLKLQGARTCWLLHGSG